MPLFRKLPVVIEAVQYTERHATYGGLADEADWLDQAYEDDILMNVATMVQDYPPKRIMKDHHLRIRTLEGDMRCDVGDWIIRGVNGELYPCKPEIFAKTYEAVITP